MMLFQQDAPPKGATHTDNHGHKYYLQREDGQWLCYCPMSGLWQSSFKINSSDGAEAKLIPLSKTAHSPQDCAELPVTPEEDAAWREKLSAESAQAMKDFREQQGRWAKGGERMQHIGPNGPTGEHYELPLIDLTDEERAALYMDTSSNPLVSRSKYHAEIKEGVWVDVYDILKAFNVTNPALQHLIKKALKPGDRGHKDMATDMQDIIDSARRAMELEQ